MSQGKTVKVDISRYPGDQTVQSDKGEYFYNSDHGKVYLIEEWYPEPEGTYRKLTHSIKDGNIKSIAHNDIPQIISPGNLSQYSSVSVYYWTLDNTYGTPLLIQLGDSEKYYIWSNSNTWTEDKKASKNLRGSLDKQNCDLNKAHILKISENGITNYNCPSCDNSQQIKTKGQNRQPNYNYSIHTIGSGTFSVSGFKLSSNWQAGLPSLKNVNNVHVFFDSQVAGRPFLIYYKQDEKWFRRNVKSGNTWSEIGKNHKNRPTSEIDNDNIPKLITDEPYSPKITIDLSRPAGGDTNILITVRSCSIGDGYHKYQYSLCGGIFMINSVSHSGTTLNGVSYRGSLFSISAYYYEYTLDLDNILMIEAVISKGETTKEYKYFYRDKDESTWVEYPRPGRYTSKLVDEPLKVTLDKLKKLKETINELNKLKTEIGQLKNKSESPTTTIVGSSLGSGLGGAGLGGLTVWKGPALLTKLITRL